MKSISLKKNSFDEKNFLRNIQIFLVCLIPAGLISGPFLPDLLIVIIGIINIYISIKYYRLSDFKNPVLILFFLWCLYITIRSLFASNILLSLESSLFYFRFGIFALSISQIIEENKSQFIKFFAISLSFTFSILVLDALFQYLVGFNILLFEYEINRFARLKGLFNDESKLGSYLVRLLPIFFAIFFYRTNKSKMLITFFVILIVSIDLVIYLSGERTAFAFLILFIFTFLILFKNFKYLRLFITFIPFFFIVLVSFTDSKIKSRMIDYTIDQITLSSIYSPEHDLLYTHAFDIFINNKIFGVGPKMFREECKLVKYNSFNQKERVGVNKGLCNTHPHNYTIQLLAETGIVGTTPYLILFFVILYLFIKQFINLYFKNKKFLNDTNLFLICGVMIGIWPFFPTGNFFNNWLNVILFLNIGLLLGFLKNEKINQSR